MTAAPPPTFALDWLGGWSERRLRRRRPGIDDLPWGTLDLAALAPDDVVEAEKRLEGWYLLTTTLSPEDAPRETIFTHYRNLLDVEDAFRETKSYLEMRPIYHQKDMRVRNHIRICFLAYWISSRLRREWRQLGETREVPLVLRELQRIRVGRLKLGDEIFKAALTDIPNQLYALLDRLKLLHLFAQVPKWAK